MTNKLHKNIIKKLGYYIIMLGCNLFISSLWGMISLFIYPFEKECIDEYSICSRASDIELYSFAIISFFVFFSLLTIMNNIVFKNVKNIWGRAFAFAMFYILPICNYIINR